MPRISALLMLVGAGFGYLFLAAGDQHLGQLAAGLAPRLSGPGTLSLAVGIIGATVMPHVVYLHSALQKNRIQATGRKERRRLLTGNKWDCIAGLGVAGLVNLAMLCVAAALFHKPAECRLPSAWRSQSGGSCMTPGSAPPRLPGRHHRAPIGS